VHEPAEIRYSKAGPRPMIDVAVPFGTTLAQTVRLSDFLSKEVISKISPRGCTQCNSGVDIWIHERFEDVIRVDLESMKVIRGAG
jgi:hypothetical protein